MAPLNPHCTFKARDGSRRARFPWREEDGSWRARLPHRGLAGEVRQSREETESDGGGEGEGEGGGTRRSFQAREGGGTRRSQERFQAREEMASE